ncbi:lysosomal acid glucosylceramidase-like isoform X1 [Cardiocondyla obscurior]|uniref:lysosomal acid glucosylceramidase-like isoform X1 n=1 Tax=Cardiocondyla obscurior TaxID=286306 RepID=UPI0039656FC4
MIRTIILITALITVKGDDCVKRSFGEDNIVCVCNSTYCDTISEPKLQRNQFLWYTSTKDGKRLELSVNGFNNNQSDSDLVLTVDSGQASQTILGFGGALTDAAALNIRKLSNETQERLLEGYYGVNGIRYSLVRIPIAGTDFSTRPYTYDDVPGDIALNHFALVEEDDYKIGYIDHIKSIMPNLNDLKIFTTSWSAPVWMKNTDKITWGKISKEAEPIRTNVARFTGTLKTEYYQLYADYIKKFYDAYKERNVDIWAMTPGNEPIDGFIPFFTFNAMGWTPTSSAIWSANYLIPTLSKAGYKPLYMALDDQRFEIPWYVDIMFKNPTVKEAFSGTAFHWYFDKTFSPCRLNDLHDKYPDKFILMTEACAGSGLFEKKVVLGSWERGERYALDIIENLSHWVTGWVDWNIALDKDGGPNWAKNNVDSPIIVIPENDEFYKQPMFYAISHFSKFVPPESRKILSTGLENNNKIKVIAFLTPNQEIVVVAVNTDSSPINLTIKDKTTNNKINVHLLANSFNTLLYLPQE